MTTTIPILDIRRRLGRNEWDLPQKFGDNGWVMDTRLATKRLIVTDGPAPMDDGRIWRHASISYRDLDIMPSYEDLAEMHKAVWPNGWAYQVFAAPEAHINIRGNALHLWGRPNGEMILPNFGAHGSI